MDATQQGRRGLTPAIAALLALMALALAWAAPRAEAERQIDIGFADYLYNEDGREQRSWMAGPSRSAPTSSG